MRFIGLSLLLLAGAFILNGCQIEAEPIDYFLTLRWTAPADDWNNPGVGSVELYDIRFNTEQITNTNWDACIQIPNSIVPQHAGLDEVFITTLLLEPATTYYFAIKSQDDAGNWSMNVSNNTTRTTPDILPPGDITDLR